MSTLQNRPLYEKDASVTTGAFSSRRAFVCRIIPPRSPNGTSTYGPNSPMARSPTSLPVSKAAWFRTDSSNTSGLFFFSQSILGHWIAEQYWDLDKGKKVLFIVSCTVV